MRKFLRARFLFSSVVAVTAIGVWVACGGSDNQDVVAEDAGADTGSSTDKDTGSNNEDTGSKADTGTPDTGPSGYCATHSCDAGAPIQLDAGDIDGGITCVLGGEPELEPNDDRATANELKPTRCGVVTVSALTDAGESDFMTFTLADASTSFYLQYSGSVKVLLETDGQAPVDITQPNAKVNFTRDYAYYAEIKSADGKRQPWRLTLFQSDK